MWILVKTLQNLWKPEFWPILPLFSVKKQPENMDPRVHDLHTHKSSSDTPVKQLSWSYSKNLRKWPNQTPMQAFNGLPAWKYKFTTFSNLKHDYTHYPAVRFLFAQLERLWNGPHTAIGTDHELFHSLNINNTNLNFELLFFFFGGGTNLTVWGLAFTNLQ